MVDIVNVVPPYSVFSELDGQPLEDGFISVGTANTNPLVETNRIALYADAALTIPLAQPLRTSGGYAVSSGMPVRIYIGVANYSIAVQNKNLELVYSALDNQLRFGSVLITSVVYPQSLAEATAVVTPTDTSKPWGAFTRYGMDPLGVVNSSVAFQNACKSNAYVYDDYPGGGTYLFTAQANVSTYPLRVEGAIRGPIGATLHLGTIFVLSAAAGAGAACISYTGFSDFDIGHIKFMLNNSGGILSQIGLRCAELRSSHIHDLSIFGPVLVNDDTVGLQFDGTGTFTGGVVVDTCYISNHQFGINCQGSITDLVIRDCTFYGTAGHASSRGINIGNANCNGLLIAGCSFNIWNRGIHSLGNSIKQVGNRFEDANPQWEWVVGTSHNLSCGNSWIGGGLPIYDKSDASAHQVLEDSFTAGANWQTTRSYQEGNGAAVRAFAMGYPQAVAFAAGNFGASGAMTWTPNAGQVINYDYAVVGKTMHLNVLVEGSTIGGVASTALTLNVPGGFTSFRKLRGPCWITNNGIASVAGYYEIAAGGAAFLIFLDATKATNWTLSANTGMALNISFPVS